MRIVSADEVDRALDFTALIDALAAMFRDGCEAPPRHHHTKSNTGAPDQTLLLMPAWNAQIIATKLVCVTPDNGTRSLPAVMANVIVMDAKTGSPLAMIDGARLTLWRTAAASALATRYLAPETASSLLVLGAGALAPFLVRAHASMQGFDQIRLWNRTTASAEKVKAELTRDGFAVELVDNLDSAIPGADVISCATLSTEPLVTGALLTPGTHLDLVGAFTPKMRETDDDCVRRASLFVDTYAGALSEGGDLVQPMADDVISREDVQAEMAELVRGNHSGRQSAEEITLFKSTGASLEDLAAAALVCERLGLL